MGELGSRVLLVVGLDELGHQGTGRVREERVSPAGREDVRAAALPGLAEPQAFLVLASAVGFEGPDRAGVEGHDAGASALGDALDSLAVDHCGCAGDVDLWFVQVYVRPAEVEQFAATGTCVGRQVEEGVQTCS